MGPPSSFPADRRRMAHARLIPMGGSARAPTAARGAGRTTHPRPNRGPRLFRVGALISVIHSVPCSVHRNGYLVDPVSGFFQSLPMTTMTFVGNVYMPADGSTSPNPSVSRTKFA